MASQAQVLFQHALFAIPQNPKQCSPAKLAFSSFMSCCRASMLGSRNMPLISGVSSSSVSWSRSPVIAPHPPKPAFVVRADSNLEAGGEATNNVEDAALDNVDEVPEAQVERVSDSDPTVEVEEPKPPRKPRVKLGDIMGILNQRAIEASEKERPTPDIRTGDIVEIKLEVPENKRRLSIYKGIVISKQNAGIHTTIRIRRIIAGVGVEIVFPVKVKSTDRVTLFLFVMTAPATTQLISVSPDELRFHFELEKQTFCDLKVLNNTENYVAFKVKTTSPKKYFVRPNTGVVQPWDSCIIRVTLQAQREYPPDMQCKDKFLLQSTIVNPNTDVDELPPDTFNKDSGNSIEELKLRVAYISPNSPQASSEDDALKNSTQKLDASSALQHLKEERDAAARQTRQLQQELDMLKRRRGRSDPGFSFTFAIFVGVIGILLGFLLKLLFSSPSTE